jgi:hypothetical protein
MHGDQPKCKGMTAGTGEGACVPAQVGQLNNLAGDIADSTSRRS